eukprot:TRINITY_DN19133_c0_g1_i1.p3 TRINITY_DN19133_c0_g1~~TRINITY_DN19133_c0_g1_i1.p3  ORF type:complete len:167 (-),score=13.20 TRINITY_DN19133_c0_g1_i1:37-537(-)
MEMTTRRRIGRRWRFSGQSDSCAMPIQPRHRNGRQQGLRIRMLRRAQHLFCPSPFDNTPQIHHSHVVGQIFDDCKVVGNEQIGDAQFALQLLQQIQDLRLHRNIEGRSRFVADQQQKKKKQRETGKQEKKKKKGTKGMEKKKKKKKKKKNTAGAIKKTQRQQQKQK